jgi:hypothetical protein
MQVERKKVQMGRCLKAFFRKLSTLTLFGFRSVSNSGKAGKRDPGPRKFIVNPKRLEHDSPSVVEPGLVD